MNEVSLLNNLINYLGEDGVNSISLQEYKYTKIIELKEELKIKAIKAARNKANNLLIAIDEKLGRALVVSEVNTVKSYPNVSNKNSKNGDNVVFLLGDNKEYQSNLGFQKIKMNQPRTVPFCEFCSFLSRGTGLGWSI